MSEETPRDHVHPTREESFHSGYDYRSQFASLRRVYGGEFGAVYAGDRDGGFYVITDESELADFSDEFEPLVTLRRFDTTQARDAYCAARFHFQRRQIP